MRDTLGSAGPRKDGSSPVDHTLRVASNVLLQLGVTDAGLVIAALLHDVVEDAAEHVPADAPDGDTRSHDAIRNEIYADEIAGAIRASTDALTVKLADFLDNGVRVDPVARPGLATKYRPLFTLLPAALMALPADAPLAARRNEVQDTIDRARRRVYGA